MVFRSNINMKTQMHFVRFVFWLAGVAFTFTAVGQGHSGYLSLPQIEANSELINREATFGNEIYLDKVEGNGFLRIKDVRFKNGTIEADIKGSNTPQQSFVGIAFHGRDDKTYDAIYLRPFNFKNPERKSHSIQYISHPTYTWEKLRSESLGKYESELNVEVDPNDWFRVRIEINFPEVHVYIDDSKEATLSVTQLSSRSEGWIGFWVGHYSDGWFRNLKVTSD